MSRLFHASRFAERVAHASPSLVDELRTVAGEPTQTHSPILLGDASSFDAALRHARRRFMLHLMYRDINGLAPLGEVLSAVSTFATASVQATVVHHHTALTARYGLTATATLDKLSLPVVVGMGKLGGDELNASSDIDLIFVHAEDGSANADRSWHEFHSELGKRVIRSLDEVTADGFVFRVDMRLRPYGVSGPLVSSLATLEAYFRTAARPWERYAWLKARALTGAPETVGALEAMVEPFVYRRYHDYGAIEEMRSLHAQIREEASKRRRDDDIKVGVGGIREVEFVAQLQQLIRGGRETRLRTRSTRQALAALAELQLLPPKTEAQLQAAYAFLRNLEHRLQYLDDQQTQALPRSDEDRARVAAAMGFADWAALLVALDQHRIAVSSAFENAFSSEARVSAASSVSSNGSDRQNSPIHEVFEAFMPEDAHGMASFAQHRTAIEQRITLWRSSARAQSLSPKLRERIESLLPAALRAALAYDLTTTTFTRVLDFLEAIDKREAYLALLSEYPGTLNRIAHLAAKSAWASDFLKRHPVLLDEFVHARLEERIDWPARRAQLHRDCDAVGGDVERLYEVLRHTKQVITLQLNLADLEGKLSVMALSDDLSALADLLLETTLVLVARTLKLIDANSWTPPAGFAVLGYGKLGSKELGYASDLDIVFLFDSLQLGFPQDQVSRYAQRVNSWLNTMTAGGVLYETDLRLRPDGAAGLMATTITGFADYQQSRAWTWEHQALTRARWCAGDSALAAPFEAIRAQVLAKARERGALKEEIVAMRDKMRAEKKDPTSGLDLKHTRGGIVDIEFIVQYLILAYANEHREFLGNLGNFALLTRAGALGIIDEMDAAGVAKAYLAFRERQHRARTNNELQTVIAADELSEERRVVIRVWKSLFS